MPISMGARLSAEFLGTYLLVFTVGCNVLCGSPIWAGLSIGAVLMVAIYALGPISGANFNPAVSVALGVARKMSWSDVGIYCLAQVVGAVAAGLTYAQMFSKTFSLAPSPGFGLMEVMLAEGLYTFMLCFVVLNCCASSHNNPSHNPNEFFGLAIGFVIVAGAYGAGAISGGAFNPAVALGIDISSGSLHWSIAYTAVQMAGAVLAAQLFRFIRVDESGEDLVGGVYPLQSRLVSEFTGTFILVLTVGLNVLAKSPAPAFSIAASLMCMIYALGDVSGAHFNPAVTAAILMSGRDKCSQRDGAYYVLSQLGGGVVAAGTYTYMHSGSTIPLVPGSGFGWGAVAAAEIVFTFVLCFVVLCVATVSEPKATVFGLAIGSCVTVGGCAIGAVSGGSLNPAVSVGIAVTDSMVRGGPFPGCLAYSIFELFGALAAAGLFRVSHSLEFQKASILRS